MAFACRRGDYGPALVLGAGLIATFAVYWMGLHGGFMYDDFPNIVHNAAVHVTASTLPDWWQAATGSPSSLWRPVAMLSFGANYYFTGLNPFWLKLINLALHLLCGALVFGVLRQIFRAARKRDIDLPPALSGPRADVIAAAVACLWLLAPINVTPVLYVVQRMAIIAQVFVLAGLWCFAIGRGRQMDGDRGWPWLALGLFVLPLIGLGGKETAVLTPAYAYALELTVFGFATAGYRLNRRLVVFLTTMIVLPLGYFLAMRLPGLFEGSAFAHRGFTAIERLLTEARIVGHYIYWTVAPWLGNLSFYHDDIGISTGLFTPWHTIVYIVGLAALAICAFVIRRRLPLISLGILWFFAGHLLTATIIPLNLAHEHRNYFPSLGLLLAITAILVRIARLSVFRLPAFVLLAALVLWSANVTALRSNEWSNPIRLAVSSTLTHPDSPGAHYSLGRQLLIAAEDDKVLIARARKALITAQNLPNSGVLPSLTLINMAGHTSEPLNDQWFKTIITRLHRAPIQPAAIDALARLTHCQINGPCQPRPKQMLPIFLAALAKRPYQSNLLAAYSQFAAAELVDPSLSRRMARHAVNHARFPELHRHALANILKPPASKLLK